MINRKVLYGYQIQNGTLEIVPEEQRTVSMVFTLYNAGASYQAISDALNRQGVPYCREVPLWNKHKVKRLLENPRYTGKEGYPILVEADIFQAAQEKTAEKNTRKQSHGEKSAIARLTPYFRCTCGGKMTRLGGGWQMVVANIVADVIIGLSPLVRPMLAPGGLFLCSGIIDDRAQEVADRLRANGWEVRETQSAEGWISYL